MNAHSVRRMRICCLCRDLGMYKASEPGLGSVVCVNPEEPRQWWRYVDPRCYIAEHSLWQFLSFVPRDELGAVRLSDVTPEIMQAILDRLSMDVPDSDDDVIPTCDCPESGHVSKCRHA